MKKIIIMLAILFIAIPLFADNAVVKEVNGRVEIQKPGGRWQSVSAGDELPTGASISTGFGSSAVIDVGASTLTVDALTRMKLEELMESQGAQTTGLFLRVGKVKAEVKRDTGLSHDFRLRSPSSTAAVRGTVFTFDGKSITVDRGLVAMISASIEREILVAAGETFELPQNGLPGTLFGQKLADASVVSNLGKRENSDAQLGAAGPGKPSWAGYSRYELYGNINIKVD